jgi:hypothetical protein
MKMASVALGPKKGNRMLDSSSMQRLEKMSIKMAGSLCRRTNRKTDSIESSMRRSETGSVVPLFTRLEANVKQNTQQLRQPHRLQAIGFRL